MKILNLYAGIGGNRDLWGDEHDITAVEYHPGIAKVYQARYPKDKVIVTDAHQYLLDHIQDGWDFIWSSTPCPSHSRINTDGNHPPRYPDMKLYEEIILLDSHWFKGRYVVENVIPYYKPLILPSIEIDRHLFWKNFKTSRLIVEAAKPIADQSGTEDRFGFNLKGIDVGGANKRQVMRNLVNPEIGLHFLKCAQGIIEKSNSKQLSFA